MKEKKIAREERNQEKLANGDWVMAEFYATWCPHCQRMKPVVEEFKKLMEGTLEVVLVDIDQEPALTDFYTVESTPTFILFRKGQQLWRQSGELPLETAFLYFYCFLLSRNSYRQACTSSRLPVCFPSSSDSLIHSLHS